MIETVYHSGIVPQNFGRATHTEEDLYSHSRFSPSQANQAHNQPKATSGEARKRKERVKRRACSKIRAPSVRKRVFIETSKSSRGLGSARPTRHLGQKIKLNPF
ncbi:hypothetical protein M9H77_31053 [Catharanthus roseus]|uniref:Uncharacterized protein n=1 Tax=Catharanthus roseus TaxID=4058 RepID=A0ACC0A2W7_CATRO|nr:hypothetical protein M9H77_31053 [Catharanthus roseus]